MNASSRTSAMDAGAPIAVSRADARRRLKVLVMAGAALLLCFARPLYELAQFSLSSSLYSHIILIPFISIYLVWQNRSNPALATSPNRRLAAILLAGAAAALIADAAMMLTGFSLAKQDGLALTMLAFVLCFAGLCSLCLGSGRLRAIAFPLAFLVFMIPLPTSVTVMAETVLQHGSAAVANVLFLIAGTPLIRNDLIFQLPGITIQVAPECSGIHSSLALFITSTVAGHLFLRSGVSRTILALAVLPLALLRNGLRIFTIGELCVQISPDMINSRLHREGGPIFFALSLIPFGLLLWALVKFDRASRRSA